MQTLIRLSGVVFSNGAILSVSDNSDLVNECTQEIGELMKLHIQGVWQNAHKFINWLIPKQCPSLCPTLHFPPFSPCPISQFLAQLGKLVV